MKKYPTNIPIILSLFFLDITIKKWFSRWLEGGKENLSRGRFNDIQTECITTDTDYIRICLPLTQLLEYKDVNNINIYSIIFYTLNEIAQENYI